MMHFSIYPFYQFKNSFMQCNLSSNLDITIDWVNIFNEMYKTWWLANFMMYYPSEDMIVRNINKYIMQIDFTPPFFVWLTQHYEFKIE